MNLIEVKNLSFDYSIEDKVLKDINLKVKKGDFLCIVGENGSREEYTYKINSWTYKTTKRRNYRNAKIGYLPQKNDIQKNFPASIEEVVISGTTTNNIFKIWYSKEDKEIAKKSMEDLNIYDIRKKCFRDLSGGQMQRVLIARAICSSKDVLVLDEPTNGLDPVISRQIYKLLKDLNKKKDLTIIMVSHDIDRAVKYADRIIEIRNGKKVFDDLSSKFILEGGEKKNG